MTVNTSLIIAAYNRGPSIGETLDSVLEQTHTPDEVIVVDDGSRDKTADWVEQNHPTVRVIRKVNGGTSSARNAGAAAASSDWLMFLDHDDLLLPHAVETLTSLASEYPQAASLHADHIYDAPTAGVRHENHHYTLPPFQRLLSTPKLIDGGGDRLYGRQLYRSLLWGNLLQQPFAIRKEAFEAIGGYNEDIRYCEDWDLYLRITQCFPVAVSDEVISVHRIEGENLHLAAAEKQEVMYEKVLRRCQGSHGWRDLREVWIVRSKLAAIYKKQGDRAARGGRMRSAWSSYLKSAISHPGDRVVLARLLLWLFPAVRSAS